jgi:hypothetical protein
VLIRQSHVELELAHRLRIRIQQGVTRDEATQLITALRRAAL